MVSYVSLLIGRTHSYYRIVLTPCNGRGVISVGSAMTATPSLLRSLGAFPGPPPDIPEEVMFAKGDKVKIALDQEAFRSMQEGHGGWNEKMNQVGTNDL